MISWLFNLRRPYKTSIVVAADISFCFLAILAAIVLRTESFQISQLQLLLPGAISALFLIPLMFYFGVYSEIARFSGPSTFLSILKAFVVYSPCFFVVVTLITIETVPRSTGVLQPILLAGLVLNSRLIVRGLDKPAAWVKKVRVRNLIIYGAGKAGRQIAIALKQVDGIRLVGFFDDDPELRNQRIDGIRVFDPADVGQVVDTLDVKELVLATNPINLAKKARLISETSRRNVLIRTVSNFEKLLSEPMTKGGLKKVEIEDLLGREPVSSDLGQLQVNVSGKVVFVSGAGGSIGSELVLRLAQLGPKKLILLENNELALYNLMGEIQTRIGDDSLDVEPVLGSVCDREAMFALLAAQKVDTIFHAAAYKHVHIVEKNPFGGIQTNYFGTKNMADAATAAGVGVFLLISSDKAVRPTNVMGGTKRLAELYIQSLSRQQQKTKFMAVRFGNVLGSSGSVIPAFRAQLQNDGPLTVTHPEMQRYFMTVSEAVELVVQATAIGASGEVMLLDMGEPVKIDTLARQMIELSGLTVKDEQNPNGQVEITYVGMRAGEKLYEELLVDGSAVATSHPRIFKANETSRGLARFTAGHEQLLSLGPDAKPAHIKAALKQLVPEYQPHHD